MRRSLGTYTLAFRRAPRRSIWTRTAESGDDPTSAELKRTFWRRITGWTIGITVSYSTFAILTHHYSSEKRFEKVKSKIRQFAHDKLQRAKWKSVQDVEASLSSEEDQPFVPTIVVVQDDKLAEAGAGWSYGSLNFLQSSISSNAMLNSITNWQWPSYLTTFRNQLAALMLELGRGEGSLWWKVVQETFDPIVHPETQWEASVRIGDDLCFSEKAFLRERKRRMLQSFSQILEVPVDELDERDLPIVAIAASGGGFRAMCNTAGALRAAYSTGILDCTTYIAAISGSCWTLGALYSGVAGSYSPLAAAEHLRRRVQIPYLDTKVMDMLITPPTNKYLLTGLIQKAIAPNGTISLVDIYGTLISARLFTPPDVSKIDPQQLSTSSFRLPVDEGVLPMPIFTAISRTPRTRERIVVEEQELVVDDDRAQQLLEERRVLSRIDSSWLWYEFSPYEVGCDELGAWIPTWSFGREFNKGRSVNQAPEVKFTILAGIYASAFCASLQHYYQEAKPILSQLPGTVFNWITEIVNAREAEFDVTHPVPPDQLPNFVRGMGGLLREGSPHEVADEPTIGLMDAGAELNIPYYPLLRRNVDCIIALDASADSQDLWFTRAEAYAARKGLRTWPRGVEWPKEIISHGQVHQPDAPAPPAPTSTSAASDPNVTLATAAEKEVTAQANKQRDNEEQSLSEKGDVIEPSEKSDADAGSTSLPSTYVWIGSSKIDGDSDHTSHTKPIDVFDEESLAARDGIGIVYMPILPNEEAVPGMDPYDVSTWSFELSMDESGKLMDLAEFNFRAGEPKLRVLLKAMWLRKMRARKAIEAERRRLQIMRFAHSPI